MRLRSVPVRMHSLYNFWCLIALLFVAGAAPAQPWADRDRAKALQAEKKFDEAVVLYRALAERNPYSGSAWSDLGLCLHAAKKYEEAIPAFQKAIELGFGRPANLYNCACACALMGRHDDAFAWLQKALEARFAQQDTLEKDSDLDSLRGDRRFAELTGITKCLEEKPALTRDDSWRWDLDFYARRMRQMHWNLFGKIPESVFTGELERLRKEIPSLSDDQMRVRLKRISAMAGDGHTSSRLFPDGAPIRALPLHMFAFKDGLYVIGADAPHADLIAAKVNFVGSLSAENAMAATHPYISVDNEMGYKAHSPQMLRFPAVLQAIGAGKAGAAELDLTLPNGQRTTAALEAIDFPDQDHGAFFNPQFAYLHEREKDSLPLYLRDSHEPLRLVNLPEHQMVYVWFGAVMDPHGSSLKEFFQRVFDAVEANKAEHLVLDMRFNGGGNTDLIRPVLRGIIQKEKINRKGHLWVIIGRHTFSAAQNTVNLLDRETHALFVGEPTSSRPAFVGESTWFVLPHSRTRVFCSSRYWQYMDSTDERIWVPPDIVAEPTFADYACNRDPAMEAILKAVNERN
jgi:tetratricopeptide (TPR) repeat protein